MFATYDINPLRLISPTDVKQTCPGGQASGLILLFYFFLRISTQQFLYFLNLGIPTLT